MSCTTQRVLLSMLLYELFRRQRRRDGGDDEEEEEEDDEEDEDDDEDDEDSWTESDSDEDEDDDDESSSSYEDDYDDEDDDDDDEDDRRRPPKLDPTQLEQLPKVEKKAFCQKWIIGQKNVDYLLKEEPLRSFSARIARTPPPPEPKATLAGASTMAVASNKQIAVPSTGREVQKVLPNNKRKLDDAAPMPRVTKVPARIITIGSQRPTTTAVAAATMIQQQPVKIIRIENSAANSQRMVGRPAIHPTSLLQQQQQTVEVEVVRVVSNIQSQNGTYPRLVTTIGPTGLPVKTLLVQNDLPSGSKVAVANGAIVPRLVTSTGQPVKLLELKQQQKQKLLQQQQQQKSLASTVLVSNGAAVVTTSSASAVAAAAADVPSKKPRIEEMKTTVRADPIVADSAVKIKVQPEVSSDSLPVPLPPPSSSSTVPVPVAVKKSRNAKRLTIKSEHESPGTVLRRSARLVNAQFLKPRFLSR